MNFTPETTGGTPMSTSDPTPGDHDELLAEADRQANYLKAKDLDGWGLLEDLTAALRTEQSARQALQQRIDAALALHSERDYRPLDGTYLGGNVCNHCRTSWPCADVRALTATTESKKSDHE